ncbi:DUF1656 domain-containing protein [Pseudomonas putida]|uniref:DUF1656 domain-containing protein n=1 Tax=Pseudomonas TaxID=286 RepID=UPI001AE792DA|nr:MULTISPECIES: DUF1656 domain-containing protein [Pseudomonas]MBP2271379.1 hypothetical protein [Pseudomonas sp. BP6]MBP2289650.1 hypothetical protein [Pseudomonas sp. BP7]MCI1024716.1 DUF1656 domain-containing protein [Pseudomonas putida]HDS1697855.1 DUF1656 domain-containing protein [Pseudomonas putida]HDS1703078.1 DUF1656 domain-containing protein [Pseudomonas putida]
MLGEVDLYGVYLPSLLPMLAIAYVVSTLLRVALARSGLYRRLWHPFLFNLALYVLVLGLATFLVSDWPV